MKPMYGTSGPATGTPVAYVFSTRICNISVTISRDVIGCRVAIYRMAHDVMAVRVAHDVMAHDVMAVT